jgi:uncharacterized membrane protein YdbT with pleckstrin-like domain
VLVAGYVRRCSRPTRSPTTGCTSGAASSRAEQQTQINRVQNVNTDQSALERLLQVGTVDFDTAAGDDYQFAFAGVADPAEVVEAVHRAQRETEALTGRPNG